MTVDRHVAVENNELSTRTSMSAAIFAIVEREFCGGTERNTRPGERGAGAPTVRDRNRNLWRALGGAIDDKTAEYRLLPWCRRRRRRCCFVSAGAAYRPRSYCDSRLYRGPSARYRSRETVPSSGSDRARTHEAPTAHITASVASTLALTGGAAWTGAGVRDTHVTALFPYRNAFSLSE